MLSAPTEVILERLAARTTNCYGKATGELGRILATALFGLATLELTGAYPGRQLGHFVLGGQAQPAIHYGFGVTVLALIVPALTWLAGLAAVWLLWRPAASAFFKPQGLTQPLT